MTSTPWLRVAAIPSFVWKWLSTKSEESFRKAQHSFLSVMLCGTAIAAWGQTAHFDGAEITLASGTGTIFAVAVDGQGDQYFTVQVGDTLGAQVGRSARHAPAALRPLPASLRRSAESTNVSGCTDQTTSSRLLFHSVNSNTTYVVGNFVAPSGVAVDSSGNLYVLDNSSGTIYEMVAVNGVVPINGTATVLTLASGVSCGGGLALDAHGDLYFTNVSGNTVNEILAVNGVIPPSPTIISLGSGYNFPAGIALDSSGDLYVADLLNNAVKELVAVNGSIPASPTILTLGSGLDYPAAVAVDGSGNVYVSDSGNNALKEILAGNGSIPPQATIRVLGSFVGTEAVVLDGKGDIYLGEMGTEGGTLIELEVGGDFEPENVGSTLPVIPMEFTFDSPGTLGGVSVLTGGASGLDYTTSSTSTCAAGTAYSAGQSCAVNVYFTPRLSGTRNGAVVLTATNGAVLATGYLSGTGIAPQVSFSPAAESALIGTGLDNPTGVALDGSGNMYVADANGLEKATLSSGAYTVSRTTASATSPYGVAVDGAGNVYVGDDGGNRVLKETPTPQGYEETVVASGFTPMGMAVDGAGDVFVVDQANARIVKETQANGSYTQSIVVSGLTNPYGVAVDGNGNLYIADAGVSGLLKETLTSGSFVQSVIPVSGQVSPESVAVDGTGNLYFMDALTENVIKETLTANTYVESTIISDLHQGSGISGLAVDAVGNVYVAYTGNQSVEKGDFADAPSLSFASTAAGTTSADSPKIVTLGNNGNAPLNLPVPTNGNNPSISANFALSGAGSSDCPVVSAGSANPTTLAAGASCQLSISFVPTQGGSLSGSLVLTDNNLNAASPNYATQSIQLSGTGISSTPSITWAAPAAITYGTALSGAQLDATASVPGTFSYSPTAGTVLTAGQQTLTVTFTPTDSTDYSTTTATVTLTVNPASPTIAWSAPAPIAYGTSLSATQLDATASVPGTFSYSPGAGTLLNAGQQSLTVTFTPTDSADYQSARASVLLTVNKVTPTITWPVPASISAGTALSAVQLDATASVAGTFAYSPAAGTVLAAGSQTLNVTFTPTNSADYNAATASVVLQVTAAAPSFTISPSSGSLTVSQGKSGTDIVTVAGQNGFNSSVTLSASGLPSGVTASFGTNPASSSSVLTLSAGASATPGTYAVTVKGVSGSMSASTAILLTVQSGFACHVGYSITNNWSSTSFEVALSIGNTGTTPIKGWTLTWTYANGQKVTQIWNATESQSGANVTVTNLSYNASIAPGATYTGVGLNATSNGKTNTIPTSFAINGTTCQ